MATWTNIPTSVLEPGKPIRSVDGVALRDNPIAIAEGATGAPRVQTNGIADSAVTTSKIADNNVTAQKLATGGNENDWVRSRTATSSAGAVGTYVFATLGPEGTGSHFWNDVVPGSHLLRASIEEGGAIPTTSTLPGSWRVMGRGISNEWATLVLRVQ